MKYKQSIHRVFFFSMIAIGSIAICLFAFWEVDRLYRNFKQDIEILRHDYETKQKAVIRSEVQKITFYIESMQQHYQAATTGLSLQEIQQEILNNIVDQRFGQEGYFFGSTFNGEPLFSNGKLTMGTASVWNLTDPNGVKIIQEQIKQAANPEGGFVNYSWNKLGETELSPKISYVAGIPEWQWVIGAGVYVDEIENQISLMNLDLKRKVKNSIIALTLILISFLIVFYLMAKLISKKVKTNFDKFFKFFRNIDNLSARIDEKQLDFPEFEALAHATNFMMEQREKSKKALQTSEEKYKLLIENQVDMLVKFDREGKFLFVNRSYCDTFGKSEEDLLGKNFMPLVHEDDRAATEESLKKLYFPPYKCYHEQRAKTKNGWRWLAWQDKAILSDNGEVIEFIGLGRDITIQKETEMENHKLAQIIHNTYEGIILSNPEGQIQFVNAAEENMSGYTFDELLDQDPVSLVVTDEQNSLAEEIRSTVKKEGRWVGEMICRRKNGDHYPIETQVFAINNDAGDIEAIAAIQHDISERKQVEIELKKYREHLEELVKERTIQLEEKNKKLEEYNKLFIGREFRIKEMKEKLKELEKQK